MMHRSLIVAVAVLYFGISSAYAQPSISSVSGTIMHKSTITISGASFGTKNPASPLKWDDGEDKVVNSHSAIAEQYSQALPPPSREGDTIPATHQIQYRSAPHTSVATSVAPPHSHSNKYIVGGHFEDNSGNHGGRDVAITVAAPSAGERWFATWYYTIDPNWPACGNSPNHKIMSVQSGTQVYSNSPYDNQYFYMDFALHPCNYYGYVGIKTMVNMADSWCDSWYQNPTACNASTTLGNGADWRGDAPNTGNWIRMETQISNDHGVLHYLINNHKVWSGNGKPNWVGNTPIVSGIKSYSIGGYYRHHLDVAGFQHNDAFRYFDDIYVDNTLSRVMLADNANYDMATVLEPQIPSSWSNSNITCLINLGRLPGTGTVYLFVFDADNKRNSTGFPVVLGGATDLQPQPPTGLKIQ